MPDRYTYPGTEVLRNRFEISEPLATHELETRVAYQRLTELTARPIPGDYDLAHLQAMYRAIYGDLWDWAGQIRPVDTGTTNTGLAHCRPEFIVDQAHVVFGAIARDDFLRGMDHDTIADRLAYHWGETTALHPFRDGNTRTQRLYFHQLTTDAGWSIDWNTINAGMDQFIEARLIAHAGHHEALRDVLGPTLHPVGTTSGEGMAGPALETQLEQLRKAAFPRPAREAMRTSSTSVPPPTSTAPAQQPSTSPRRSTR